MGECEILGDGCENGFTVVICKPERVLCGLDGVGFCMKGRNLPDFS